MKIAFLTLGCKLNYAETSTYERGFVAAGMEVVDWEEKADVYLVNTCSVTERAEKKCRNVIRKVHRVSPEAKIIVTGCYAELRRAELEAIEGVAAVFGAAEKTRVVPDTLELIHPLREEVLPLTGKSLPSQAMGPSRSPGHGRPGPSGAIPPPDSTNLSSSVNGQPVDSGVLPTSESNILSAYSSEERTRSFLKVQDGCNNFCAYCTVPYARGTSRNIPIATAVAQAREIAATGIKEVVITGVNTGDYGRTTGESFLDLLKRLNDVEGIERYRISSIEPNLITEEIIDWIASGTKFQPHFHIPLQSGSDQILQRVRRRYTTDFFAERIDYIRSVMDPRPGEPEANLKPFVFFGIDVIAGLPGETDELFEETYSFLKERVRPAFIHIFPYSRRPGTVAAGWKDQVRDSVKTERVARLEALCEELHSDFVFKNKGRISKVLWESDVKDGMMGGYSGNYIRVTRPYDPEKVNTIEDIIL
ncbi:MAG: tRNA (N(6)-L-threonylcarbamoyladenosine(37)-C(2))-methylthiotransferase MtaB [Bacteroidales bacterium]|nr:tRNA (N(6)-L-threonylcarbamoyladenosine(37)-C(2))-methylthiotransferase MtaB [Bacteroidales bacterium]MBQ6185575.1 tRNA (N(6)-L-threonylcarbamoyladenosine(37)-C(2))-methylthiotransferase MtaB [Bacteroidales bacterium]